jgi:hypothetical protein
MAMLVGALNSLYDSLNSLFFRMAPDDDRSMRVAKIMLKIGELLSNPGRLVDSDAKLSTLHALTDRVAVANPLSGMPLDDLLSEIEAFLTLL